MFFIERAKYFFLLFEYYEIISMHKELWANVYAIILSDEASVNFLIKLYSKTSNNSIFTIFNLQKETRIEETSSGVISSYLIKNK